MGSNRPPTASIHVLDDDSLLHVFFVYCPFLLGEDQDDSARLWGRRANWARGRWWYKPCPCLRNVILGSASPLPLFVDYFLGVHHITTDDEEGTILALKQRDRVRRVRLKPPITSLQRSNVVILSKKNIQFSNAWLSRFRWRQKYSLKISRNTSSTTSTPPQALWLR